MLCAWQDFPGFIDAIHRTAGVVAPYGIVEVLDVPLYPFVDLLGQLDPGDFEVCYGLPHLGDEIGIRLPGNTKAVQLVKPTAELVKTAVVNCAKVGS